MPPFPSPHFSAERIPAGPLSRTAAPPTKTAPQAGLTRAVLGRQATVTVLPGTPDTTDGSDLSGGAIAGIVVGSVVGFLLLLWVTRSCYNLGAPPRQRASEPTGWYDDVSPVRSGSGSRSRRRRRSSRHSHRRGGSRGRRPSSAYYVTEATPRRPGRAHVAREGRRARRYGA